MIELKSKLGCIKPHGKNLLEIYQFIT